MSEHFNVWGYYVKRDRVEYIPPLKNLNKITSIVGLNGKQKLEVFIEKINPVSAIILIGGHYQNMIYGPIFVPCHIIIGITASFFIFIL